jgi:hypothetical protein
MLCRFVALCISFNRRKMGVLRQQINQKQQYAFPQNN